jgi:hypothetical protein
METERELTVKECELLADTFSDEAAALPFGSKKEDLLKLAESYRVLAQIKQSALRMEN